MNKPRVLILMHYLELGGAEISLISLLHALDPAKVEVDLFLYSHQGALMKYIPEWVNLLPEIQSYSMIEKPIKQVLKQRNYSIAFGRLIAKIKNKFYNSTLLSQQVIENIDHSLPPINLPVCYDLCISFLTPHNIAVTKVNSKKTLAWIHTDYSYIPVVVKKELPIWEKFDYIASISPSVTNSFLLRFPSLKNKIIEIENILSAKFIKQRAKENNVDLEGSPVLISIGRFSKAKNFDNVPLIAKKLVDMGLSDLKWYLIGFGTEESLIRKKITEFNMQSHIKILGRKENPYPYINACDIYIQPSRYEGKSITVREAQILCKPVIITEYPTSSSQVKHGIDGLIVPLNNEGCAKGIFNLIKDKELQKKLSDNCSSLDFYKENEISKLYQILDNK